MTLTTVSIYLLFLQQFFMIFSRVLQFLIVNFILRIFSPSYCLSKLAIEFRKLSSAKEDQRAFSNPVSASKLLPSPVFNSNGNWNFLHRFVNLVVENPTAKCFGLLIVWTYFKVRRRHDIAGMNSELVMSASTRSIAFNRRSWYTIWLKAAVSCQAFWLEQSRQLFARCYHSAE